MPKELISIIIPIYNVELYVERCVESVLAQSYQNLEILLIDDGSTDRSGQICDGFANKDKKVKVIHQSNGGLSFARNVGINASKGKYLFFLDGDDFIHSKTIDILYSALKETNVSISSCDFIRVKTLHTKEANVEKLDRVTYKSADFIYFTHQWSACGKLFDARLFRKRKFIIGQCYEDFYLIPRILTDVERVTIICKPLLYFYVQHQASIMDEARKMVKVDFYHIIKANINYFKAKGIGCFDRKKIIAVHMVNGLLIFLRDNKFKYKGILIFRLCILSNLDYVVMNQYISNYAKKGLLGILLLGKPVKVFMELPKLLASEKVLRSYKGNMASFKYIFK